VPNTGWTLKNRTKVNSQRDRQPRLVLVRSQFLLSSDGQNTDKKPHGVLDHSLSVGGPKAISALLMHLDQSAVLWGRFLLSRQVRLGVII